MLFRSKEIPADQFWTPTEGQKVYVIGLDGTINELDWHDNLNKLQGFGNVFETREQAGEVSEEINVIIRTFQEKYNSERKKNE